MASVVDGATSINSGDPHKLGKMSRNAVKGLAITQLVMGSMCVIFEIAMVVLFHAGTLELRVRTLINGFYAPGIWNGLFILIIGVIGVVAAMENIQGWIIAYMVFNIIGAVAMPAFIALTGLATTQSRIFSCTFLVVWADKDGCDENKVALALNILNLLMAISQFIITIVAASLCCGPACCNSSIRPSNTRITAQSGSQQTVVAYTANRSMARTSGSQLQPGAQVMQSGVHTTYYAAQLRPASSGQQPGASPQNV